MLPKYKDILELADKAGVEPIWWDENGVPRFSSFDPEMLGVYDRLAVLGEVACAACGKCMQVGIGRPKISVACNQIVSYDIDALVAVIEAWGDPPRHNDERDGTGGHGCAGETMSSDFVRVVGAWEQCDDFHWRLL